MSAVSATRRATLKQVTMSFREPALSTCTRKLGEEEAVVLVSFSGNVGRRCLQHEQRQPSLIQSRCNDT